MRKSNQLSIGEAIKQFLTIYNLDTKIRKATIIRAWSDIVGTTIASRTTKIFIKKNTLYITVDSAPLRNELTMSRHKLMDLINAYIKEDFVQEIVIK